jgi:hypothetical protein
VSRLPFCHARLKLIFRNTGLLSFGEAEEGAEEFAQAKAKKEKKGLTRMDRECDCIIV